MPLVARGSPPSGRQGDSPCTMARAYTNLLTARACWRSSSDFAASRPRRAEQPALWPRKEVYRGVTRDGGRADGSATRALRTSDVSSRARTAASIGERIRPELQLD